MGEKKTTEIPAARAFAEGPFVKPYLHSGVADAYQQAAAAVSLFVPVVAVTGQRGCGRTTIATAAAGVFGGAALVDLSASDGDMIAAAAVMLGGKRHELPRLLAQLDAEGIVFLIDGPGVARAEALDEQVSLLLQLAGRPAVVAIAGDRSVIEGVLDAESIVLRGPVVAEVGPMRPEEVEGYLVHRLSNASLPEDVFASDCAVLIGSAAAGVPARINTIARNALAIAWSNGLKNVGMAEVSAAIAPPDAEEA